MSTIAQQVRELQDMDAAALADRYAALYGVPPRIRNRIFLQRRVGWKLQELEFGGLSRRANARLDQLIEKIDLPLDAPNPRPTRKTRRPEDTAPLVGTTLTKRWHDQDIHVEVHATGFEWDGTLYRSLSAVAKAITGTVWNGRLFFGLVQRRKSQ